MTTKHTDEYNIKQNNLMACVEVFQHGDMYRFLMKPLVRFRNTIFTTTTFKINDLNIYVEVFQRSNICC